MVYGVAAVRRDVMGVAGSVKALPHPLHREQLGIVAPGRIRVQPRVVGERGRKQTVEGHAGRRLDVDERGAAAGGQVQPFDPGMKLVSA